MKQNNIIYKITAVEEEEILPIDNVKQYLRVSHENDDGLIKNLTNSAINYAEQFLGFSFSSKKITCLVDSAHSYFKVKYVPILELEKIYLIKNQIKEDITENFGNIDSSKIWIDPKYWNKKIEINYKTGFENNIPEIIKQGILMHVGIMYDFGANTANIFSEIKDMYLPYRNIKV